MEISQMFAIKNLNMSTFSYKILLNDQSYAMHIIFIHCKKRSLILKSEYDLQENTLKCRVIQCVTCKLYFLCEIY